MQEQPDSQCHPIPVAQWPGKSNRPACRKAETVRPRLTHRAPWLVGRWRVTNGMSQTCCRASLARGKANHDIRSSASSPVDSLRSCPSYRNLLRPHTWRIDVLPYRPTWLQLLHREETRRREAMNNAYNPRQQGYRLSARDCRFQRDMALFGTAFNSRLLV
jgi:hypothetical protein